MKLKLKLGSLLFLCFLLIPVMTVQAVQWEGEADTQQLSEQAQKMQACMAKIDQDKLNTQAAMAEKAQVEIEALCKAGKRDEAQDKGMAYAKEIYESEAMQEMKKCMEMATQMMQQMNSMQDLFKDIENRHVCDDI